MARVGSTVGVLRAAAGSRKSRSRRVWAIRSPSPVVSRLTRPERTIYAIWEFWGNGKPQQYYSIKTGLPPGPGGTLAGTVTDQNGQGVAGVTITVPNVAQTVTTAGGAYTFPIPAGSYTGVTAVKNNYTTGSANVTITANTTTTQNYVLTATTPNPVTNLAAKGYDGRVLLTWTNPTTGGTQTGTNIRAKTTGFPTGPTDGTQVADVLSSNASYIHTGLTNGTTYYYAAYAYFADASALQRRYDRFLSPGCAPQDQPAHQRRHRHHC